MTYKLVYSGFSVYMEVTYKMCTKMYFQGRSMSSTQGGTTTRSKCPAIANDDTILASPTKESPGNEASKISFSVFTNIAGLYDN